MINEISWVIAFASLIGVWLNIKKKRQCFYIWSVTNFSWFVYDFMIGATAQALLFFVYFVLAIYGLYEWRVK